MDKFAEELNKIGITLTDIQREQFDRYYELLVERNSEFKTLYRQSYNCKSERYVRNIYAY